MHHLLIWIFSSVFSLDVKLRRRDGAKRTKYTFCLFEGGKFLK